MTSCKEEGIKPSSFSFIRQRPRLPCPQNNDPLGNFTGHARSHPASGSFKRPNYSPRYSVAIGSSMYSIKSAGWLPNTSQILSNASTGRSKRSSPWQRTSSTSISPDNIQKLRMPRSHPQRSPLPQGGGSQLPAGSTHPPGGTQGALFLFTFPTGRGTLSSDRCGRIIL